MKGIVLAGGSGYIRINRCGIRRERNAGILHLTLHRVRIKNSRWLGRSCYCTLKGSLATIKI